MTMYQTYKKELGPGSKNEGRGQNFRMTAKIRVIIWFNHLALGKITNNVWKRL